MIPEANMNLEQIKYILEINKEGSISAAADKLFISQSAISQSLTSFETELGVTIFNRSRTGCTLTEIGEKVIPLLNEIIDKVKELSELEQKPYSAMTGSLKISMSNFAFMSFLPEVIEVFKNTIPNVSLEINDLHLPNVINEVLTGSSDFGLILANEELLNKYKEDFKCHILYESELKVCMNKNSPLAEKEYVTPKELLDFPWVLSNKAMTESFKHTIPEFRDANILFFSNNSNLISGAILNNSAITFLTDISLKLNPMLGLGGIVSKPVKTNGSLNMYFLLVYLKNRYLTVPDKEFIKCMESYINKL